jgi:hypothetical protein
MYTYSSEMEDRLPSEESLSIIVRKSFKLQIKEARKEACRVVLLIHPYVLKN